MAEKVVINLSKVKTDQKVEISLDYLRQMMVILVQVRGFMERAETGAMTATEAETECQRILALVQELHTNVVDAEAHVESLRDEMDAIFQQVVNDNLQKILDALERIDELSVLCEGYKNTCENDVAEANQILNSIRTIESTARVELDEVNAGIQEARTLVAQADTYCARTELAYTNALASEGRIKTSEDNAKASEINAKASENVALSSASSARSSEVNAKASETSARSSENIATSSASSASVSATNAALSANAASISETTARGHSDSATSSAISAADSAISSKSDADRSEYYANTLEGVANFELDENDDIQMKEFIGRDRTLLNEEDIKNLIDKSGGGVYVGPGLPDDDKYQIAIDPEGEVEGYAKQADLETAQQQIVTLETDLTDKSLQIERLNEDVRLLKHFAQGELYTEYTDDSVAHEKAVPKSADMKALLNSVGGKSVVVNQGCYDGDFEEKYWKILGASTNLAMDNNEATIVAQGNYTGIQSYTFNNNSKNTPIIKGHNYFIIAEINADSGINIGFGVSTSSSADAIRATVVGIGAWKKYAFVGVAPNNIENTMFMLFSVSGATTFKVRNCQYIDLTTMFGAGNEPTLEQCQQIFTDYIPYTEPTIKHLATNELVVRGKNLRDVEYIRNVTEKGWYFNCEPNTDYTASVPVEVSGIYVRADGIGDTPALKKVYSAKSLTFNSENNTRMRVSCYIATGLDDIYPTMLIEKGTVATEFAEPIETTTIPLPTTEQDGYSAGSVCNERDFARGKRVKRIVEADMSSLVWGLASGASSPSGYIFRTNISDIKIREKNAINNALSVGYSTDGTHNYTNQMANMEIMVATGSNTIYLRNDTYDNDLNAFRNSLAGQKLYYELAEYEETDLEDTVNPLIVEGNGSVEFVNTENSKVPIPSSISYCVSTKEGL